MELFTGSGVALITPFDENGDVNYSRLREILEFHVINHTDAIIVTGTTGEGSTLSDEEKISVIEFTVDIINSRIPVIAGTGSNDTRHAVEFSKRVEKLGVDGLLVVTPYYNKGNENGIYEHYKAIAEGVKIPVILYNVPSRTGVNLSIPLLKRLAQIENITALKEASGNISYVAEVAREVPELDIYSGNDDMVVPVLSLGGKGVISVSANIIPDISHDMTVSFLKGDIKKARELQLKYNDLVNALFLETNPVPVKEAMNFLGYEVGNCRLPLGAMNESNRARLTDILTAHEVTGWK
ncbi:4-hydroxy-tetrahydrodipicolinate synthase [Fusobacterium ulcerans]|uniref:4-hydroxy-tetrahydrodipicolinate synthase n=1 Tax=Fusobacterium ulcerans TaxID=861 RepID=A0AAX2JDL8_9FUSO|nr:4-hydroxy-tetrahydrodipicolinate synthase [Fusobacterium ulcerans]AVQ27321.1 4-hydroxy-tetrahydrodipicolinate synthase [Fusobacterium ulcerans]EFS24550.2 dihydrodipicolinate synthase [Fusobacterium ulcerans ATCC 49185]SQJ12444.1 Dihydrodipicolinate synthase [Fusobacterium ulcerans]